LGLLIETRQHENSVGIKRLSDLFDVRPLFTWPEVVEGANHR